MNSFREYIPTFVERMPDPPVPFDGLEAFLAIPKVVSWQSSGGFMRFSQEATRLPSDMDAKIMIRAEGAYGNTSLIVGFVNSPVEGLAEYVPPSVKLLAREPAPIYNRLLNRYSDPPVTIEELITALQVYDQTATVEISRNRINIKELDEIFYLGQTSPTAEWRLARTQILAEREAKRGKH